MPERISPTGKLYNRNRSLWQIVLFLMILVAVTVILVISCLYRFVHQSDFELSLYEGLVSSRENASSGTLESSASALNGNQAKDFDFRVSDSETVWSTNTSIELFQTSYRNDKGEITVQSADEDSVVAPGTGGSYTFSLKNASNLNSNYKIWMETDVNVSSAGIPIEFRMRGSDGWLDDGAGEWLSAEQLNAASERKNLYSGKSTEYTLYWRWPYEGETDEADTTYGNLIASGNSTSAGVGNVSQTISYKVVLHTLASEGLVGSDTVTDPTDQTVTPTVTPADRNNGQDDSQQTIRNNTSSDDAKGSPASSRTTGTTSRKPSKTGDNTEILCWILILILAVTITVVAGKVIYQRKKDRE